MKKVRILTAYGQGGILDEEFLIRDDQYVEVVKVREEIKE